ncbi:hypothetical protein [Winogradskyella sp. A3E31]|uniref:hypothetical protein n=1 Tax=Winogradskyella sp. A3E31 TaxID=3349637 RepID=UPI00398AAC48
MKTILFGLSYLICLNSFAQKIVDFKSLDSIGRKHSQRLIKGDIEFLKNYNPPPNTWSYNRLLDYKKALVDEDKMILSGRIIGPSNNDSIYSYNFFAYHRTKEGKLEYFFVTVVSIDISSNKPNIENSYLFTEGEALKSWWMHIFGLYHTKEIEEIPKEYQYPVCPPPPFERE